MSSRGGGHGRGRGRGGGRGARGGGGPAPSPAPSPQAYAPRPPSRSQQPPPTIASAPTPSTIAVELEQRVSLREPQHPSPAPAQAGPSSSQPAAPSLPLVAQTAPSSSKARHAPIRPGFGKAGKKCLIRANHFLVKFTENMAIFQYDVSISPEASARALSRAVVSKLVEMYRESHLGRKRPAYDGRKSLYTAGPLPFESKDFAIKLIDERGERDFKVSVKFASQTDLHHLQQFLIGRQRDAPQEIIHALDVALRATPTINYIPVGRSFFSRSLGKVELVGDGLECWRGFYQSIRPSQMGLSLNMDVSCTAFYEPICVVDFICKYIGVQDVSKPISDTAKVKKVLRRVKVRASHRNDRRQYKVSGLSPKAIRELTFVDDGGRNVSVVQYFREKYGVTIQLFSWPALNVGSESRPIYLPMEICTIVEGQRYSKKLNEVQVTALLRAACKRPLERERNTLEMVRRNSYNRDENAREFGLQIQESLCSIEARILPPPELRYHPSGREPVCQPRVGQWNMINKRMINGGDVKYWACVSFSSRMRRDNVDVFCNELVKMCQNIGMGFSNSPLIPHRTARADKLEVALNEIHTYSARRLAELKVNGGELQLLIVILPEPRGSYGPIKRICETQLGIVTQCCQSRHASRSGNKQYLENVSLKINVKVGGRNTVLAAAVNRNIPLVTDSPTIIFGADVTHPPPGEDTSPSIAAVVASMDWPEVSKYRCLLATQLHRQELISDLYQVVQDPKRGPVGTGMIIDHMRAFRRATGLKPHRIIFYRDGVSEGQFSQVLLHELDAIYKACGSLEADYMPPVTFVVVQKRHHTRLFPADHGNRDMTDRSGNILPGTVVDTQICHPKEFDFYLCSHAGIQGTSRPTHYHVLWDENNFSADALQILTNNLCYTFARCTRSVSVVPPAYYAHLAAFRARYYIEGESSDGGSFAGGSQKATKECIEVVRRLPIIKDNVKEVMFYC